ncbi:uncharacterized protein PS065_019947 isoform 1-T1 [Dugong dugon]
MCVRDSAPTGAACRGAPGVRNGRGLRSRAGEGAPCAYPSPLAVGVGLVDPQSWQFGPGNVRVGRRREGTYKVGSDEWAVNRRCQPAVPACRCWRIQDQKVGEQDSCLQAVKIDEFQDIDRLLGGMSGATSPRADVDSSGGLSRVSTALSLLMWKTRLKCHGLPHHTCQLIQPAR